MKLLLFIKPHKQGFLLFEGDINLLLYEAHINQKLQEVLCTKGGIKKKIFFSQIRLTI